MQHIQPTGAIDWLCVLAIASSLYMFSKVYIVITLRRDFERRTVASRLRLVRSLFSLARNNVQLVGAVVIGVVALAKGTGRVAFIFGGLTLATATVTAGCPAFLTMLLQHIAKQIAP